MIEQICLTDVLLDGAKEVFETMIFMEMEPTDQPIPLDATDTVLGSITFKGNLEGLLSVACFGECAKAVSANMLGMDLDEGISQEDISDAIGEVSNMVMGSLKSRIQDIYTNIDVSIPSVVIGQKIQNTASDSTKKAVLDVCLEDQHFARFTLLYRENK